MLAQTMSCPTCEAEVELIFKSPELNSRAILDYGCPPPQKTKNPFSMPHIIKTSNPRTQNPTYLFITKNPAIPQLSLRNLNTYISGPISAFLHTDKNAPAFEEAENKLAAIGLNPLNPLKTCKNSDASWEDCMQDDLITMIPCGLLVMLSGWLGSTGACKEYLTALTLGIPVLSSRDLGPVILTDNEWAQLWMTVHKKALDNCKKLFNIG